MVQQKRKLIVHEDAKSPIAEAYRTLRTNIQFSKVDGDLRTIMFTSAGPGEGKSTTAANTAVAISQTGKQVIIVDCDLRKPVQHKIFGKRNRGLTNILVEELPVVELVQDTDIDNLRVLTSGPIQYVEDKTWKYGYNLRVLTSGPIPPNPSELLGSARMVDIIDSLKNLADIVILDAPPTVAVTDACVLASKVDGIVLVLNSQIIRPEMAQKAKELLTKANGHILGVILNKIEIEEEHAYYYYYYGNETKITK